MRTTEHFRRVATVNVVRRFKHFSEVTVSSQAVALFVSLEASATVPGSFSDNGFVLLAGEERVVEFIVTEAHSEARREALRANVKREQVVSFDDVDLDTVKKVLRVRSLWDTTTTTTR